MQDQYGLEWHDSLGDLEPRWSAEPSLEQIERISRQHLHIGDTTECTVAFLAQGGFNKLFTVNADAKRWTMRVALPVDPYRKTASEVSTMCFVRESSSMPVPTVFAYDASSGNSLRFEWILMEYMPGTVLERIWRTVTRSRKEDIAKTLAKYQSELFRDANRHKAIGNLFKSSQESYEIGSIVSMTFFWGDRGARDTHRGPFKNSYEWLSARLKLVLEDQDTILATTDDEDEVDDARATKCLAERLIALLPSIFRADDIESTVLFHDDLHENNLLVDESGITAVLDWECVSFFPLWMACQPPALFNGPSRLEEPERDKYLPYDPETDEGDAEYNEGVTSLYWIHHLEYERAHLRQIFLLEMERLDPQWLVEYRNGELKRDVELAILHCDGELTRRRVRAWLDAMENGERYSLREHLNA